MARIFNNVFINIASKLKEPTLKADFEKLKCFVGDKVTNDIEFKIPLANHAFIRIFLSNLNVNKSTGLDNIAPRILKMSTDIIAPSLLFIGNKSITSGKFPSLWKEAKVKPLYKADSKEDVNNYGPISILQTLSKLIEKWVGSQFSQF